VPIVRDSQFAVCGTVGDLEVAQIGLGWAGQPNLGYHHVEYHANMVSCSE
jgi:hypothetical protein